MPDERRRIKFYFEFYFSVVLCDLPRRGIIVASNAFLIGPVTKRIVWKAFRIVVIEKLRRVRERFEIRGMRFTDDRYRHMVGF